MSDEDEVRHGEILSPKSVQAEPGQGGGLAVQMPPVVRNMPLSRAILGQLPYWGARRTIDAYRRMVDAGTDSLRTQTNFLEANRNLEAEKGRWENRAAYRQAAMLEADAFLDEQQTRRNGAAISKIQSEQMLTLAREQDEELALIIAKNNQEAERLASERRLEEERQKLHETQGGRSASFHQKMRRMQEAKQNFDEIEAAKKADIEKYRGEENLPEFLSSMYVQMEADLSFDLDEK